MPSDTESSNSFGRCTRVTLGHLSMGPLSEKRSCRLFDFSSRGSPTDAPHRCRDGSKQTNAQSASHSQVPCCEPAGPEQVKRQSNDGDQRNKHPWIVGNCDVAFGSVTQHPPHNKKYQQEAGANGSHALDALTFAALAIARSLTCGQTRLADAILLQRSHCCPPTRWTSVYIVRTPRSRCEPRRFSVEPRPAAGRAANA